MGYASRSKKLRRLAAERDRIITNVPEIVESIPEPEPVISTEPIAVAESGQLDVPATVTDPAKPKRRPGRPAKALRTLDRTPEAVLEPVGTDGLGLELRETQEEVLSADSDVWLTKAIEKHPTKGEGPRGRIAAWLMLRAVEPSITVKSAADKLGVSRQTLHSDIVKAVEQGWLKFDESLDQVRYQLIPKVIRNVNHFLDDGDRQVTIEMAKGTILKQFAEAEGFQENKQTTILALRLELPESTEQEPLALTGKIVAQPRQID